MALRQQYGREIEGFFDDIDGASGLTLAYSDVLEEPEEAAASLVHFLDIPDVRPLSAFLRAARMAPTPFGGPVADLRATYPARGGHCTRWPAPCRRNGLCRRGRGSERRPAGCNVKVAQLTSLSRPLRRRASDS